jgi:hypothetical protein
MRRYQSAVALQRDLEAYIERAHSPIEQRHIALLLEQVLGNRIRQRRAAIEEAESTLSAEPSAVWAPIAQSESNAADVVPESSRTVMNSSAEIEVPSRGALGYALRGGAVVLAAGLAVALGVSRAETSETTIPTLGRASVSAPPLDRLAQPRAAPATSAEAEFCVDHDGTASQPLPGDKPKRACSSARVPGKDGAKVPRHVR